LQRSVRLGPGVSVIELGGGGGSFLLPFARLGCECYALDFSNAGLRAAEELFKEAGYRLHTISGDLMALDTQLTGGFDVVVSYGLCEHFQGRERTAIIAAHAQLMKKGGASLISVPNKISPFYQVWWGAARLLSSMGQSRRFDVNIVAEWAFSPGELKHRCIDAGFEAVEIVGTPIAGDFIDMLLRPLNKFAWRLAGREYRRPARAHAFRSPFDDLLGSYLYGVATDGPTGGAVKNSSLDRAKRNADQT